MSTTTPEYDYDIYDSRSGVAIAAVSACLSVAFTAVALRVYTRAVMIRQFGADDWAAVVAYLLALASGLFVATNVMFGHGKHLAYVIQEGIPLWKYFRHFYISIVLYNGSLTATKLTFLLQYYRILGGTGRMRKAVIVAFVIVGLWSVSQLLVVIFTCSPIEKFWNSDLPGTCIPNLPFWYINAAGNIVTDIIVFLLPLPSLTRLNLRKGQKLGLIGVFSLGFFTCAISVIRIQYLKLSTDVTWDNVPSSCWSIGELCSGITCACLPTLRPLLAKVIPGMSIHSQSSQQKYYRRSTGRDFSNASRLKSTDENGSSRGIMYPEDLEMQSDNGSDKEIRIAVNRQDGSSNFNKDSSRSLDKLRLGLNTTVKTEIKVGTPTHGAWSQDGYPRGIEVKRDFITTTRES